MNPSLEFRLSKAQVMALAGNLRYDECGIEEMFTQMKQTNNVQVANNAAWVLSYLFKGDKEICLLPRYGELVDMATSTKLHIRRGLVFFAEPLERAGFSGETLPFHFARRTELQDED